jgi:hypothetical protein
MGKAYITNINRVNDNTAGVEPVTVSQQKTYLQLEGTAFDDILTAIISSVRQSIENYCNVSLVPKSLIVTIRTNGLNPFNLPFAPVGAISLIEFKRCRGAIWTTATDGEDYTLFDYNQIEPDEDGNYRIYYTTLASGSTALLLAIKQQVAHIFNGINEPNKVEWDATAMAIMNANKNANY